MRSTWTFAGLSLGLLLALPAPATPEAGTAALTPTATLLARSTLLGMQINVRERRQKGQIATLTMSCVESLDVEELTPVYQSSLTQEWGATTLAASDAFLMTSLGEKVAKISQLDVYRILKQVPPEPAPELTSAEQSELAIFSQTDAGLKLFSNRGFTNEASRQSQRSKLLELAQSCGLE
jgi:hypothetical protein